MKRIIPKMKGKAVIFTILIDKKGLFHFSILKIRLKFNFVRFAFKILTLGYFPV